MTLWWESGFNFAKFKNTGSNQVEVRIG